MTEELQGSDPTQVLTSTDVLDATGPFLLSRVFTSKPQHQRHLVASALIYPFSKDDCWHGLIFDLSFWIERSRHAFVAHYWDSSWFKPSSEWHSGVPSQAPVHLYQPPSPSPRSAKLDCGSKPANGRPLVSCLMVTRGRPHQARQAIDCFLAQTYDPIELIIIDDDSDSELAVQLAGIDSSRIRHVRLPDQGFSLGVLRNVALDHALGDYICQWDDDDLHDPVRLEVQMRTLQASDAQASILARWLIWWPHLKRLAVSRYRDWEGSLLCERSLMPRYLDQRCGEDSELLAGLMQTVRMARIDMPRLYVYICHGTNTFSSEHFEPHWHQATARWDQGDYELIEQELDRRLPLLNYRKGL
ncbi:MAG: glycosyltransferase family A protein [Cyanobacteria bacterium]|nr:glycosyltransferase family A protein [Cyanobacteriota bacterium]